jgi:class 3 adenylate cyclase/tetratricopeptide (TPR) repeat protein
MANIVTNWLEQIGLGQHAEAFFENAIAWEHLPELDHEMLLAIGVKAVGHRITILKAVEGLSEEQSDASFQDSTIVESDDGLAAWERHPDERKPATVLFTDITGSTALTEHLDAEDTHEILDGVRQRMCAAVVNNRGTVCRVMGDGVMALFGAPVASEHHAVEACEAALEMQQSVRDYAGEIEARHGSGIKIRVGLHSGEIVVLVGGNGDKVEYDADGPTVPIAARMEQSAEPGTVYMTAATQSLAASRIETEALTPVSVRGISEPVPVFTLHRVRPVEESTSVAVRTPYVGRRSELSQFRGILDTCIEGGQGQTVYVRGDPGIGKTRLVEEFSRIATEKGVSSYRGLVLPFGVGKGQDAIRSLVRKLMNIPTGSSKAVRERVANEMLTNGSLDPDDAVFLYDLLDLQQPPDLRAVYDAMNNATRNTGKQTVVSKIVTAQSNIRPLLVIVEDVHWSDDVTLAHLSALTKAVSDCPSLLVMTSRIEGDPLNQSWRSTTEGSPFVSIDLGPLRKQDSIALIADFLDTNDALAVSCLERAAGNPLFLEQLLRNVQEGGSESLPDSIQSLVLARLDRLAPEAKLALQSASVIGQRFHPDSLSHLLGQDTYDCSDLVEHNLVRSEGNEYLFAHALIQESVYGSMLKRQRHALHEKAAEWFAESDLILHAQHLDHASNPGAPMAYLRGAEAETTRYRYQSAVQLIERGISIAVDDLDQNRLRCLKGKVLQELGSIQESIDEYQSVLKHLDDEELHCKAYVGIAAGLRVTDDYEKAFEYLNKAEPLAKQGSLWSELSRIHYLRGSLCFPLARLDESLRHHQLALEYGRKAKSPESEALALSGLGDVECANGRMITSKAHFDQCVDLARSHGFGRIEVANAPMLAWIELYLGDVQGAYESGLKALKAAELVGNHRAALLCMTALFVPLYNFGDIQGSETWIARSRKLVQELGARRFGAMSLEYLAKIRWQSGLLEEAEDLALEAVEIARQTGMGFRGPATLGTLALVTQNENTRCQAIEEAEELLECGCVSFGYIDFHADAIEVGLLTEDWSAVHRYADRVTKFFLAQPLPWVKFYTDRGRALADFGRGRRDDATIRELRRLLDEANRMKLKLALPALKRAISLT